MRIRVICALVLLLAPVGATRSAPAQASSPADACSAPARLQVPEAMLSDVTSQWFPAGSARRLLFQGGIGLNGSVAPPLGRTGAGDMLEAIAA